jgi:hypothetical protein
MRRQLYHEINRLRAVDLKLSPLCRSVFADALLRLVVIEEPTFSFFDFDRVECASHTNRGWVLGSSGTESALIEPCII